MRKTCRTIPPCRVGRDLSQNFMKKSIYTFCIAAACATSAAMAQNSIAEPTACTPPAAKAVASAEEIFDVKGHLHLKLRVKKPSSEVSNQQRLKYWVAAVVPAQALGAREDKIFLLTGNPGAGYFWQAWNGADLSTGTFAHDQPEIRDTDVFIAPLGLMKKDFQQTGASVHFAYQIGDGEFKIMDYYWKP